MLRDPGTGGSILVEPLADKPADKSIEEWLQEVGRETVANPIASQEWDYLDGALALKMDNRNPDGTESVNVYVVNGVKTFAIRASQTQPKSFDTLFRQMLSTFRFTQ